MEYTIANQDDIDLFDLVQGGTSSLGNVTDPLGVFPFTNPNGNTVFGDDTFAFILGGLFIDGGLAPNLDWTFSENVHGGHICWRHAYLPDNFGSQRRGLFH